VHEKRRDRRVPFVAKIEAEAAGKPYLAEARNISTGGMLIRTTSTLPEGHVLHLRFTLPGTDREIYATAVVQHISPESYMGVRFDQIPPADREAIREYVDSLKD
jgi:uncharacterized protein (TIGR02266 family)